MLPQIDLNGSWEIGLDRNYTGWTTVPGIPTDPSLVPEGKIWLRRFVTLPRAPFARIFLLLKGARFCPSVYVDGVLCAQSQGGMAPVRMELPRRLCAPGRKIAIEICLLPLDMVPMEDASRIPEADVWRTNVCSCIWDDVVLQFTGSAAIAGVLPACTQSDVQADVLLDNPIGMVCRVRMTLRAGDWLIAQTPWQKECGSVARLRMENLHLTPWEERVGGVYNLTVTLQCGETETAQTIHVAPRNLCLQGKGLMLNGHPLRLRGTSIGWNRFCRDPEGSRLAFDPAWMSAAILDRLQDAGANFLRIHLGLPPEWLLDECDRRGLCVQLEWLFFHGLPASEESLYEQWRSFFMVVARHPCVCVTQMWNETEGDVLQKAYHVLDKLKKELPLPILHHIDMQPVHKYWWSLFENLSLSYDSPDDFDKPVIVDEFGGNYLDGNANPGLYPEAAEAFTRFLGARHTADERLELQALANARVAEYWRILGVAGYASFCALGAPEDGNHHFLGALADNRPKPVWAACSAAYAPEAACVQLWNRAFMHGERVEFPLWFFRDTAEGEPLEAQVEVVDPQGIVTFRETYTACPSAYGRARVQASVVLPASGGSCVIRARLGKAVSAWPVRLYAQPERLPLKGIRAALLTDDAELAAFLAESGAEQVALGDACNVLIGRSPLTPELCAQIEPLIANGADLLLLDVGPQVLGEGYLADKHAARADGPTAILRQEWTEPLPFGLSLRFEGLSEPESCCHCAPGAEALWQGLHRQALQISNGYRGGLNVPAASMTLDGVGREAYRAQWLAHGAPEHLFDTEDSIAYSLCGFYAFAEHPNDDTPQQLRAAVWHLLEDAPSLEGRLDPTSPIATEMLTRVYRAMPDRRGVLRPIAVSGHSLEHINILELSLDQVPGRMIFSQLITRGRLTGSSTPADLYAPRQDPEIIRLIQSLARGSAHGPRQEGQSPLLDLPLRD